MKLNVAVPPGVKVLSPEQVDAGIRTGRVPREPGVRLYGHKLGYTSFRQVTRGFALALGDVGLFGGFVPLDFFDEEVAYPGSGCDVSVNTGMPSGVARAKLLGVHKERWLMLAPNSDRIPGRMVEWMPELTTALLSPSRWGVQVLRDIFGSKLPVHLVPHGVHSEYQMVPVSREERRREYEEDRLFRVLHMTSTNSERKGTKKLLRAWRRFGAGVFDEKRLTVVCRREGYAELKECVSELGLRNVTIMPSDGAPYAFVNRLYGEAHVVCQPSRGEGFGLIPLEAKACGLPVVMTDCTGHRDHFDLGASVLVETGDPAPSEDMEGATTPSLSADAIYEALCVARENYPSLDARARRTAPAVRRAHSWTNTTGRAMKELLR